MGNNDAGPPSDVPYGILLLYFHIWEWSPNPLTSGPGIGISGPNIFLHNLKHLQAHYQPKYTLGVHQHLLFKNGIFRESKSPKKISMKGYSHKNNTSYVVKANQTLDFLSHFLESLSRFLTANSNKTCQQNANRNAVSGLRQKLLSPLGDLCNRKNNFS